MAYIKNYPSWANVFSIAVLGNIAFYIFLTALVKEERKEIGFVNGVPWWPPEISYKMLASIYI